jgi:hypothetical protein
MLNDQNKDVPTADSGAPESGSAPAQPGRRKLMILATGALPAAITMKPSMAWATSALRGTVRFPELVYFQIDTTTNICGVAVAPVTSVPAGTTAVTVTARDLPINDVLGLSGVTNEGRALREYARIIRNTPSLQGWSAIQSVITNQPNLIPSWLTANATLPNTCPTPLP